MNGPAGNGFAQFCGMTWLDLAPRHNFTTPSPHGSNWAGGKHKILEANLLEETSMKILKTVLFPAIAVLSLGLAPAFAQTAPAAPAPATTMMPKKAAKPAMSADQKASVSKACSAAADKQSLHGKARKSFRDKCKDHGGPAN
jgi:hypothetical protein